MASTLFTQNIIACVWDFDKTLIPAYMQAPLFRRYGIDEATFWAETNALAENYRKRGYKAGLAPVAEAVSKRILTLPMFPAMDRADVNRVVAALQRAVA